MIYSVNESANTYTEAVALFGHDADEFLESVEVALYEDAVAIGENVYDGAEAEAFLAENGIFLYEDHIVLEGKQAEEYKARKAKEKDDQKAKEDERDARRYRANGPLYKTPGDKQPRKNLFGDELYKGNGERSFLAGGSKEDAERQKKTRDIVDKERHRRYDASNKASDDYYEHRKSYKENRPKGIFNSKQKKEYDKNFSEKDKKLQKEFDDRHNEYFSVYDKSTSDAVNRHLRRHPKNESTIFDFELK